MLRIVLFLATNLAVMVVVGIIMSLLGLNSSSTAGLLVMCFLWGMGGSFVSLFLSKWMAKKTMGVHVIDAPTNSQEQWLLVTVQQLSDQAGIKMPEVGIFDSSQPNAFATGWNKNAALVAVSTGIMQSMTENELRAVLGHEIGHVSNGDMVTLALIQGVVNSFVIFFADIVGRTIDRAITGNDSASPGFMYSIITMVLQVLFGILASVIVCWFSRHREFRADVAGAKLGGRQNMIDALAALDRHYEPISYPQDVKAMAINSKDSLGGSLIALLSTHPPIPKRIAALQTLSS